MNLSAINELDFNNIGDWPLPAKAALIVIGCLAAGGAVYYFDTRDQLAALETAAGKERKLFQEFESKQKRASSLPLYKEQLAEMKQLLGGLVSQLPSRTEVAALLVDVSQTGLSSGLEFELFQPEGEQLKEFYAELPIRVRVNGRYHDFGRFVSDLAGLRRIVTIHDIKISAPGAERGGGGDGRLTMQATIRTYRYLDEETAP